MPKEKSKSVKSKKKFRPAAFIAKIAAVVLACVIVGYTAMCFFTAVKLVNPPRRELAYMCLIDGIDELDLRCEPFSINGLKSSEKLRGWWIPAQQYDDDWTLFDSDKTVIFSHNYESSREMNEINAMYLARSLARSGYNVIVFDYSGCGISDGKNYTFGAEESDELRLVVKYAADIRQQKHIALMGWGFGAAAAINAGCNDPAVSAVIADSSYLDLDSYLDKNLAVWTGINDRLFNSVTRFFIDLLADYPLQTSSPLKNISATSGKSFLFLHGDSDTVFPASNSQRLCSAAEGNNVARIKIFENTLHIYGYVRHEDAYVSAVTDFLASNLSADTSVTEVD